MLNGTCMQFFEWYCASDGHHWNRFRDEAPTLVSMGVTAVWLPPAFKGTRGDHSEGYDVYDIYDLGEFDQKGTVRTKYGTKDEYVKAITSAREAGLHVYVDIVLNHMGGTEEIERIKVRKVNPDNRLEFTSDEMEIDAYTKFTFPGRGGKYSNFVWDYHCFTGLDYAADLNDSSIYSIVNEYGDDWEPVSHDEKGNFDYLILNDIETRNPAVREELKRWIKWYYETCPFDGVRLDAVKHINPSFFIEWLDYVRKEIKPDLFALGEFWLSDNLAALLKYIEITEGRMSLFDAPLHHNIVAASLEKDNYDLRKIFDNTLVKVRPDLAVTFIDNHDTQPLQSLEEFTDYWFRPLAYALILLRHDGYPCIFYPDLYGSCYKGKNKKEEDCDITIAAIPSLRSLVWARKIYSYGEQADYFDDPRCIGWVRYGHDEVPGSGCVVLISNNFTDRMGKEMSCGEKQAGKTYYDFLGHCPEKVTLDETGKGYFMVEPFSVSVWVVENGE